MVICANKGLRCVFQHKGSQIFLKSPKHFFKIKMSSLLKISVFLGASPCILVEVLLCFREFCCLRHQITDVSQEALGSFETSVTSTRVHDVAFQRQQYILTLPQESRVALHDFNFKSCHVQRKKVLNRNLKQPIFQNIMLCFFYFYQMRNSFCS